jgi:hypothetical protein
MKKINNLAIYLLHYFNMTFTKAALKFILRRNIVALLILANVAAFAFADNIINNNFTTEENSKRGILSQAYTGWQMLDWSFSLIDYLGDITDR